MMNLLLLFFTGFMLNIGVDLNKNKRVYGGYDERFPMARELNDQIHHDESIYQIAENMMKLEQLRKMKNREISEPLREILACDIIEKRTPYGFQPFNGGLLDDWNNL